MRPLLTLILCSLGATITADGRLSPGLQRTQRIARRALESEATHEGGE